MPDLARHFGLDVENIHTSFEHINMLWLDEIGGDDVVNMYLSCVDDCCNHQVPTMVLHLQSGKNPPAANHIGIDRLKRIVDKAERKNVNIALENMRKPEYLNYVFSHIHSDKLMFCYDSGHENCFSKGTDLLNKYGNKLIALHLSDNDGDDDQHRIPGYGNINWASMSKKLKTCNYRGSISLEVTNEFSEKHRLLSAEQFLQEAHEETVNIANAINGYSGK